MSEPDPSPRDVDELPPPWAKHPEIPSGSIGWRMGYGESYLMEWYDWLARQPKDRAQRAAYLRRHPPAPRTWSRTVASVLEPDRDADDDADDDDALIAGGLVGDDVAMGAWEAIHGDAPEAPWAAAWPGGKPDSLARYGGRELTFWARWCAKQRARSELDAWLTDVPAPERAWEPLHEAVRTGAVPSGWQPASEWERIAVLVAAYGEAPPPWTLGEPPSSLRERYEDDSSYADAWCAWVYQAFDDGPSWRAYVERHGGVPAEWRAVIERAIWIGA